MEKILVGIRRCSLAEDEHARVKRYYAHVGHRGDTKKGRRTICVAYEFFDLPFQHKIAIIAHEVGHLLGHAGEDDSDAAAEKYFGIKMYYQDTIWGKDLEWVTKEDADKVYRKLNLSPYLLRSY